MVQDDDSCRLQDFALLGAFGARVGRRVGQSTLKRLLSEHKKLLTLELTSQRTWNDSQNQFPLIAWTIWTA